MNKWMLSGGVSLLAAVVSALACRAADIDDGAVVVMIVLAGALGALLVTAALTEARQRSGPGHSGS
jgi:hypothetical protein